MMKPKMALVVGKMDKMGPPKAYDAPEEEGEEPMFKLPDGMEMKPGETKEVVCTIEAKDDGMVCVRKVNGMEVPGYEDRDKPDEEKPSSDTFTDAAMPEPEGGEQEQGAM